MLSLHKMIKSNWEGYANMRVPVKVLQLLPWEKAHLLSFYIYRAREASEKKQQHFVYFPPKRRVNR